MKLANTELVFILKQLLHLLNVSSGGYKILTKKVKGDKNWKFEAKFENLKPCTSLSAVMHVLQLGKVTFCTFSYLLIVNITDK